MHQLHLHSFGHTSLYPYPSKSHKSPKILHAFPHSTISSTALPSPKPPITHSSSSSSNNNNKHNDHNKRPHCPSSQNHQTKLWNTKINHHLQMGDHQNSISLYHQMLHEHIPPNSTTFSLLLKFCSSSAHLKTLRLLHNDILRLHFDAEHSVIAALIDAYLKCGRADLARQVIERMSFQDVVSWTMIVRLSYQDGHFDSAIWIFRRMLEEGVSPDGIALVSIIMAVTSYGCLQHGMEVHGYLIRKGFEFNEIMMGSLVNMYTKLGKMAFANRFFNGKSKNNVVIWTALISGLIRTGDAIGAVTMFEKMVNSGVEPTENTMSCVLRAISQLGSLQIGIQVHAHAIKRQFTADPFVTSGLIDMYAKCTDHAFSCQKLFDKTSFKSVVLWTTMISAHRKLGDGPAALRTFNDMLDAGVRPDSITFTSVLSACCSSGMLQEGLKCFDSMIRDHNIRPREEHYAVLMDLIAKDGRLEEAYELIESMDLRGDGGVWEALLCACRVHGNVGLGEFSARRLIEIESNCNSSYTILSDIYSAVGRWEDAHMLRQMVKKRKKEIESSSANMNENYVY